jgi:hypothetical protein
MIIQYHISRIIPSAAVFLSTNSSMGVQGVFISAASSMYVQTPFLNAEMSKSLASSQSGKGMNENTDAGTSPVPD